MEEKRICKQCGEIKNIGEFGKVKTKEKITYRHVCKKCKSIYFKKYYNEDENKDKIRNRTKQFFEDNKDEMLKYYKEYNKKYYLENKDDIKIKNQKNFKIYYKKNKDKIKENYNINKEKYKEYRNREDIKNKTVEYNKNYFQKNKTEILKKRLKYQNERRKEDDIFRLKKQVRSLINSSFKRRGELKSKKTEAILGCNLDFFVEYLLKTYKKNYGCEWDNEEKVHIDHIIPLATANDKETIVSLCNYKNLQLLKAKDNLKKSSKIML